MAEQSARDAARDVAPAEPGPGNGATRRNTEGGRLSQLPGQGLDAPGKGSRPPIPGAQRLTRFGESLGHEARRQAGPQGNSTPEDTGVSEGALRQHRTQGELHCGGTPCALWHAAMPALPPGSLLGTCPPTSAIPLPALDPARVPLRPPLLSAPEAWDAASNLLAVRLDALGDVLMTTPALRALKRGCPNRRITLLTSPAEAALAQVVPEVDAAIAYQAPLAHCHENPYQLLTDWVPDREPFALLSHEVRRQLDLVAAVGYQTKDERLSLRVPQSARCGVRDLLNGAGLRWSEPWVVIHPGASAPSQRYPAEGFATAAGRLAREAGWRVVWSGDAHERELIADIQAAMGAPSISLAGRLALPELCALVEQAPLLICNNTGPAHVAAAVGTPVVDLYTLTNPQHTPWQVPCRVLFHDVPCRHCYCSVCPERHHRCLRLVSPHDIVQAARELWDEQRNLATVRLGRV